MLSCEPNSKIRYVQTSNVKESASSSQGPWFKNLIEAYPLYIGGHQKKGNALRTAASGGDQQRLRNAGTRQQTTPRTGNSQGFGVKPTGSVIQ